MGQSRRIAAATLGFLLAGCATQVAAPRASDTPTSAPSSSATPRPTNAASDTIYLRSVGSGGVAQVIVMNARAGETLHTYPDGSLSPDRGTLYASELVNGATQTLVRVIDVVSGRELRSFTVDGEYMTARPDSGISAVSRDGRHLVLGYNPGKFDDQWVSHMAVVDTASGAVEAKLDVKSQSSFAFGAISPDGTSLYLNEYGDGTTKVRVFDVPTRSLLPATVTAGVTGLTQNGFRTPGLLSPDGRWMYSVDAGNAATNCTSTDGPSCVPNGSPPYLVALDLGSRRVQKVALPTNQLSTDFEKYLLWSVGVAPSGDSVYAVNPALGVIDEIDARLLTLRRTAGIPQSRTDGDVLAAITRFFFPIADAKRYITGGAVLSPDGTRIYAVAYNGVSVVGTESLSSSAVWKADNREFDALALTPDGERLYAVSNASGVISIISTRDGSHLGELKIPAFGQAILRIDPSR